MSKAISCALLVCLAVLQGAILRADPAQTYAIKCSGCHTFGKGPLVGPDLKGLTDRYSRDWLAKWIAGPERLAEQGDATARELLKKFAPLRMPDMGLSPAEIASLLDYLADGGPEADALKKRRADTATPEEIERGRSLFVGQRRFARGGAPCAACHSVSGSTPVGGTLGPELSRAYVRFQDHNLRSVIARGCFPRVPFTYGIVGVNDEESFALRAFLRDAGKGRP